MKKSLKHILITLLFSVMILPAMAQVDKAEVEIEQVMKELQAAGLSVTVVKNNKKIYQHSFGLKSIENNIRLSDNDIFRIASISKSFSATSIMQLVEHGKFSLEDDFSDLVGFKVGNPKFPNTVITLKMVLSHRSSVNDSQGYFNLDVINPAKNPDWQKCYNSYEPGMGYEYCNLNFNMVGTIIEKYSGERFDQYVKHHILDPLGIYGGYCVDSLDNSRFATIYEYNGKSKTLKASPAAYAPKSAEIRDYTMGYSTPILSPTGGMKISASDLAKYMTMHMNYGKSPGGKRIISKRSSKTMQTKLSDVENYGLALLTNDELIDGKTMVGHTGSAYGLYSAMFFNPKEKFGIVAITNGCNPVDVNGFNKLLYTAINSLYKNLIQE